VAEALALEVPVAEAVKVPQADMEAEALALLLQVTSIMHSLEQGAELIQLGQGKQASCPSRGL
jgi:hypothetical protein